MGEIGVPRSEFLYAMSWWEIECTIRGYRRRGRTQWETARLVAYCAAHAFGSKNPKPISRWLPFSWEEDSDEPGETLTAEQVEEIREMIRRENENKNKNKHGNDG